MDILIPPVYNHQLSVQTEGKLQDIYRVIFLKTGITVCLPQELSPPNCRVYGGRYRNRYRRKNPFLVRRSSSNVLRHKLVPRVKNSDFRWFPPFRNGSSLAPDSNFSLQQACNKFDMTRVQA
ncbi:hypothetical protein AVEN_10728-1 [Araneus ventricosus]|uniref:Uncharacterized protein n=1 Tax=Araneus ventricosus TaxID=182803 RepID=A0A4Y2G0T4_ARAVE|nr:hypothetical protein AVEN_10728-1 [Araneus ventricosus]